MDAAKCLIKYHTAKLCHYCDKIMFLGILQYFVQCLVWYILSPENFKLSFTSKTMLQWEGSGADTLNISGPFTKPPLLRNRGLVWRQ